MVWLWKGVCVALALLVLAAGLEALIEARNRARLAPPGRLVDIGGRRLHIHCKGDAQGPTVIIEPGAGGPSMLWWAIQDKVSAFARVCTYDRAGYFWSDPAARRRSLQDRVADLHALLQAAHVPGPYILVAHSYGGPLVRLFAQAHPQEVAGMVLVDTPEERVIFRPSYVAYAGKIGAFSRALGIAARFGIPRLAALFLFKDAPDGLGPAEFQAFKALLPTPAFFQALEDDTRSLTTIPASMQHPGGFGTLGDRPLVVITHGIPFPGPAAVLEDGWAEGQQRLSSLSTRGELVVAANSNHMIQSDEPEIVIDAIRRVVALAVQGSSVMALP
jgi:pimeloyl-ACP methyl ester carboxylesterase